ncbi:unnamed protein product [Ambrosiozyma monospora]|uniref:Unnamed protein product n=1 Tax=Ambrosiozyma monospora TaxID=43982 RepID=A0ACB5SSK8_AMBMO|nr:unnamed protein product [Ambrosiozyma monospora]
MTETQPASNFRCPKFKINSYPPHYSAFCRNYPVVAGQFTFDLSSLKNSKASLKSIEIGLKGHVRVGYSETRYSKIKKTVEKHTENHILFDQSKIVYDGSANVESSGVDGMLQSEFRFVFPSDKKLPSTFSYKSECSTTLNHVLVMYYLYAKLSLVVDETRTLPLSSQNLPENFQVH